MALSEHTLTIIISAANDALDFKKHDPDSITTLADCIQANFEAWERKDTTSSAALALVKSQLRTLGYHF